MFLSTYATSKRYAHHIREDQEPIFIDTAELIKLFNESMYHQNFRCFHVVTTQPH